MAEFNPYKLEEEKWTPKNVYEILPPSSVSWSDYDFGQGTDNVDQEAANKSLIDGFVDFFKELFGTAGKILGGALELGGKILGGFVNGVVNLIGGIANAIGSIFGGGPTESPYPPMFSPIKANLEAAIQPFKDQIQDSYDKSEELLAEQVVIRGQIAEQVDITRAAVADAKAASERAGVAIAGAEAASAAATEARETLESYNTELNKRITKEFNTAVGRADTAVGKADTLAGELADFKAKHQLEIADALGKAEQAVADLATLTPKVSAAQSKADSAYDEAGKVRSEVTPKIEAAQSKGESALAVADKAVDWLKNPVEIGTSVIAIDPETKRPYYANKLELVDDNPPGTSGPTYMSPASMSSVITYGPYVPVDSKIKYTVSFWAKANVAGSMFYGQLRTQEGRRVAPDGSPPVTGSVSVSNPPQPSNKDENGEYVHNKAGNSYFVQALEMRTEWTYYETEIQFTEGVTAVSISSMYWSHNSGVAADQYISGLDIRPQIPTQASVDKAQNDAIRANADILVQQGLINEAQRVANLAQKNFNDNQAKWTEGANKAIQANTDVAVALARINGIQVGGRNLLKKSDLNVSNSNYLVGTAFFGDSVPKSGEEVTISIKGSLGAGKTSFAVYNSGGSVQVVSLPASASDSNGVFKTVTKWRTGGSNSFINIYAMPNTVTATSKIEWVKLERGNQASDWTPAPEDLPTQKQVDETQNTAIRANTDAIKALGKVALGDSLITHLEPSDKDVLDGKAKYDTPAWTSELLYIDPANNENFYNRFPGTTPIWRNQHKEVSHTYYSGSNEVVAVNDQVEYKWSMWASVSAVNTRVYLTMEDETGNPNVIDSGSHVGGNPLRVFLLPIRDTNWVRYEGTFKFVPGTKFARVARLTVEPTYAGSEDSWFWISDLQMHPNVPDANVVNELQDNAIRKNTEVGTENKKAIDALTEGLDAYAAAADLESLHKHLQDELEKEQDARADLAAEINNYMVESIPRTIIYGSGPQFNDHILAERSKITAKPGWVGQMLIDVTYVSKSDGSQTKRVIKNYNVPDTDGSRVYSVPSASFGGYQPAYRLDYWVYRGRSIQKALSNSGSYITGSSFTKNSWTRIATHSIKKSNGAVHILWRTRLTRADRGVTYSFDVRVNGKSVLPKSFKGYGPLTGLGDGGATLSFSGNLSVPDNGKIEIYAKANGTTSQASVSSNKGTLSYLELE